MKGGIASVGDLALPKILGSLTVVGLALVATIKFACCFSTKAPTVVRGIPVRSTAYEPGVRLRWRYQLT